MKRYMAELVGTFVLVFGGCGSAVLAGDKIGFAGVSFAFGCMPSGPFRAATSTPP
jgi:aquaporin Z